MRLFEGTELDRPPRCERCDQLEADCACPPPEPKMVAAEKQTARIQVEKRKRGKVVTVVRGLNEGHPGKHLADLLTTLKNKCGAGGAIHDMDIEIQGNHLERLKRYLSEMGFKVRG